MYLSAVLSVPVGFDHIVPIFSAVSTWRFWLYCTYLQCCQYLEVLIVLYLCAVLSVPGGFDCIVPICSAVSTCRFWLYCTYLQCCQYLEVLIVLYLSAVLPVPGGFDPTVPMCSAVSMVWCDWYICFWPQRLYHPCPYHVWASCWSVAFLVILLTIGGSKQSFMILCCLSHHVYYNFVQVYINAVAYLWIWFLSVLVVLVIFV